MYVVHPIVCCDFFRVKSWRDWAACLELCWRKDLGCCTNTHWRPFPSLQRYNKGSAVINVQNLFVPSFCLKIPCAVLVFQVTNHEEVISQSLCNEETKTKVVAYLSKVISTVGSDYWKRLTCDLNSCGAFPFADGKYSGRGGAATAEDQTGGNTCGGAQWEAGEPERESFERRFRNLCSRSRGLWLHQDKKHLPAWHL